MPTKKILYYREVIRVGDGFESAEGGFDINSAPIVPELEKVLSNRHSLERTTVNLGGIRIGAEVFVSKRDSDSCYLIVDSSGRPPGYRLNANEQTAMRLMRRSLEVTLQNLQRAISTTESMVPETSLHLPQNFIQPSFVLHDHLRRSQKKYSWEYLSQTSRAIILGGPGAGKTTCLRQLTYSLCSLRSPHALLPIYVQLRNWRAGSDFLSSIVASIKHQEQSQVILVEDLQLLARGGSIALVLDGLDEIELSQRQLLVHGLRDFAQVYPRCRLLLSSRSTTYLGEFPEFDHLELLPFTNSQIAQWCYQLKHDVSEWRSFYSSIGADDKLNTLASNPLTLSMLYFIFRRSSVLPYNRSELISRYIDAMLSDWDAARGVNRYLGGTVTPHLFRSLLLYLGGLFAESGNNSFKTDQIRNWMRARNNVEPENIMYALASQTGLVSQRSNDEWSFQQSSIAEFLAARCLVEQTQKNVPFSLQSLDSPVRQGMWEHVFEIAIDADILFEQAFRSVGDSPKLLEQLLRIFPAQNELRHVTVMECALQVTKVFLAHLQNCRAEMAKKLSDGLEISIGDIEVTDSGGGIIVNVLRLCHKLRKTNLGVCLSTCFSKSNSPILKQFGELLAKEGLFMATTSVGAKLLIVSIERPYSNIG